MRSWHLVKHGELPTSYLQAATILKVTSHEVFQHLTSSLRHTYEYLQVLTIYIIGCSVELIVHNNSSQLALQAVSYDLR